LRARTASFQQRLSPLPRRFRFSYTVYRRRASPAIALFMASLVTGALRTTPRRHVVRLYIPDAPPAEEDY